VPKLIIVLNNDRLNDSVRTAISRRVHRGDDGDDFGKLMQTREKKENNANREAVVLENKKDKRVYTAREKRKETCPLCTFYILYCRLTDR
jgi:hypothetical protein